MSLEKNRQEAERWLITAEGDLETAILLDRYYIPTRYPNGLPDLTPEEAYLEEDAQACIENAKIILGAAKNHLNQ